MGGCPHEDCSASGVFIDQLQSLPCRDTNPDLLKQMRSWSLWWEQWLASWTKSQPRTAKDFKTAYDMFVNQGCAAMAYMPLRVRTMVCHPSSEYGSISSFCPVACGCGTSSSAIDCPAK